MIKFLFIFIAIYSNIFANNLITADGIYPGPPSNYVFKLERNVGGEIWFSYRVAGLTFVNHTRSIDDPVYPELLNTPVGSFYTYLGDIRDPSGNGTTGYVALVTGKSPWYISYEFRDLDVVGNQEPLFCNDLETPNRTTMTCDPILGYHSDDNNVTVPDIACPPSMVYEVEPAWHGLWATDKKCVPNSNLTPDECADVGGEYGSLYTFNLAVCHDPNYLKNLFVDDAIQNVLGFMPFNPLWNSSKDLVVQAVNKLFAAGKNSWTAIKSYFDSTYHSIQAYEPIIYDMQIGSDGVTYEVGASFKYPTKSVDDFVDTYNKFRENGWDLPETIGNYDPSIHPSLPPLANVPRFPVVQNTQNLPLVGVTDFSNNIVGTKSILDEYIFPTAPAVDAPLNSFVIGTSDIKNSILDSSTKRISIPTKTIVISRENLVDRVVTKYKTEYLFPDNTFSISTTELSVYPDGSSTGVVTHVTPIKIGSGVDNSTMTNTYVVTTDSTGNVINSFDESPTVIETTTASTSTTIDNTPTTTTTTTTTNNTPSTTNTAVDLSMVESKLTSIDTRIQNLVEFKPADATTFDTVPASLSNAISDFEVSLSSAFVFFEGMQDNLSDLYNQFDNAKATFEDKPQMIVATGSCPFTAPWVFGQTTEVDPCMFVRPFKPILSLFFTMYFTIMVFGFSLKYLFNISLGGNK